MLEKIAKLFVKETFGAFSFEFAAISILLPSAPICWVPPSVIVWTWVLVAELPSAYFSTVVVVIVFTVLPWNC